MTVRNINYCLFATGLGLLFFGPLAALAVTYEPLVGIPGIDPRSEVSFGQYINQLYFLSISIAALIAVVKIIWAGVQYMLSDIVTDKASAKADIKNSLLGLLLIIAAVVILTTINPELQNLNAFRTGIAVQPPPPPPPNTPSPERWREQTIAGSGAVITETTINGLPAQQYQAPWFADRCPMGGSGTRSDPCTYTTNTLPGGVEAWSRWDNMRLAVTCAQGQSRVESNFIRVTVRGIIQTVPSRYTCVTNPRDN
jgi:uncharacterized membrane protein